MRATLRRLGRALRKAPQKPKGAPRVVRIRPGPSMWVPTPKSPSFLRKAKANSFQFEERTGFKFYDGFVDKGPCFVLKDSKGQARFVLGFRIKPNFVEVRYVQRVYSSWPRRLMATFTAWFPNDRELLNKRETAESKKFAAELNIRPNEFLLAGFLYWAKKTKKWDPEKNTVVAKVGGNAFFTSKTGYANARALYERFFKKKFKTKMGTEFFTLNKRKERVKEILESE